MMSKAYCNTCNEGRKSGYCKGTAEKPHAPEPCPPCSGCRIPCDWTTERGCKRFTVKGAK